MNRRTKFYLDKQHAKWKGVCAGIADYTGIDVVWVRVATLLFTLMGGFPWTLIAYIMVAWMSDTKPIDLYFDEREEDYWKKVRKSPRQSARAIKSQMRDIDRRLADIEHFYTTNNRSLANEIEQLRDPEPNMKGV